MKIAQNKSTRLRPDGDRTIDAPFLLMDIPQFISQIKNEKQWAETNHNAITVFKSPHITIVVMALKPLAKINDNNGDNMTAIYVLNGKIRCITKDGEIILHTQQQIVFHEGMPDVIEALSDADIIYTNYSIAPKKPLSL